MIFFGIDVAFRGWSAEVAQINLLEPQFDQLGQFLSYRTGGFDYYSNYKPEDALVIFDNGQQRLIMVKGKRETWSFRDAFWPWSKAKFVGSGPYVHILKTDPNDQVFVSGDKSFGLLAFDIDRDRSGFDASWFLPREYRLGGRDYLGGGIIFMNKTRMDKTREVLLISGVRKL